MSKSVLVVEDDEMVADVVRVALNLEGYDVSHVTNAAAARSTISTLRPDLILLDITLPDVDGWTFMTELREGEDRAIPIMVMTAKTMPADEVRGLNLGAAAYLRKPFSPETLVDKVNHVLGNSATT